MRGLCSRFFGQVVVTEMPIGNRPAILDHSAVELIIADGADRKHPRILIEPLSAAHDLMIGDECFQLFLGRLSASPGLSIALTGLVEFGCIDPEQPNALCANDERIAIYYVRRA